MKRAITVGLFLLIFFLPKIAPAQQIYLLLQGGRSSYGDLYIGNAGGGGGDQYWKPGPIFGIGVRLKTSHSFSVDGTVEYSSHPFKPWPWDSPINGDPRNSILDVNVVGRLSFGLVGPLSGGFSFGLGYWYQQKDPIEYEAPYARIAAGHTDSGVGIVLGFGLGFELAERLDLYFDGNIRGRRYVTPVLQLGLGYRIH